MMSIAYRRSLPLVARFILALALSLGLTGGALAEQTMAEAMANAIARMMESMGFANTGVGGPGAGMPAMGQAMPYNPMSMPGMTGLPSPFGAVPGGQTMPGGAQMNQMADRFSQSLPLSGGVGAMPWGASSLEGVWEDNQGGLLIVQGAFYRIYSACDGFIEGGIGIGPTRIELTNSRENFTQTFEFALDQGRLVLRSQSGEVFLYRRLVLGQGRESLSR
ncbi:hypothetical protein [Thiocystis violascens]|uniref:DUF306 domain-containing protein n=1 Tax=Thiocystis violascens (strain ATCC 17096 / DSM 198 / 6111) TaxID=765911 RepID=I3YH81_THIV6|nr:hypothetical protein [Thiocystis violascens]AFL76349.1 hypothetical protein Thivi_4555 [Thiocystis violascens DSM 198]